jgi:O-antigen/teichoic acid export membrane protein
MIITQSVFPAIVNAKKVSEELYYKRLQRLYALMVWFGILIASPVTFLSDWIITFLYGQAYLESAKVLMISIWVIVFVFLGVAQGVFFTNNNLQKQKLLITLFCGAINIILNIFLIGFLKTYGAAFATLISYALSTLFFPLFFKDMRHFMIMTYKVFYLRSIFK